MKSFKSFLLVLIFFSTALFAQNNLNLYNTSWSTVLSGKVLCEPQTTSFGFVIYTDAKTISAFSESGNLLWEKNVSGRDIKLFVLPEDFILVYKGSTKSISLLNPSGTLIWERQLSFALKSVIAGRDGRFFVKGQNNIECYGITGIRKWQLETQNQTEIEFQQLPDGSLVVFLEANKDGKTPGLRISPFGELLEEITFSGRILSAESADSGVLVTFSDGTAGFFSLSEHALCENKWVLQGARASAGEKNQIDKTGFIVSKDGQQVFYLLPFKNFVNLYKINQSNGQITLDFSIQNIKGFELKTAQIQNDEIFLCDDSNGYLYSIFGKEIYGAKFTPASKFKWNYLFFTNTDFLVFCGTNWSLNSYKYNQNLVGAEKLKKLTYDSYLPANVSEYAFAFMDSLSQSISSPALYNELLNGDYGSKEKKWVWDIQEACLSYVKALNSSTGNSRKENTVFDLDTTGVEFLLKELGAFGTDQFNKNIVVFLSKINNKSLQCSLLEGMILNGYDPDHQLLDALEVLTGKVNYKDEYTLCKICDAVYSVCQFMGRPAFNSKGKAILSKMLFPSYNSNTRTYARNTLKKITDLEL